MQKEIIDFIEEKGLSPFYPKGVSSRPNSSIFKSTDAKSVYLRVVNALSKHFVFDDTAQIWQCFPVGASNSEILRRQDFFRKIPLDLSNHQFKDFVLPKPYWNPAYGVIVVTEDEKIFLELKELDCPVKYLINEQDVLSLESYDLIQAIECENFSRAIEQLPQSIFLDSVEEAYLERHVRTLSGWKNIIENLSTGEGEIADIAKELLPLLPLARSVQVKNLTYEDMQNLLSDINGGVSEHIKSLTLSGEALLAMLHKSALPSSLKVHLRQEIIKTGLPDSLFIESFPVVLNDEECARYIKKQNASQSTSLAEEIKRNSDQLTKVSDKIKKLSEMLLLEDFKAGISMYLRTANHYPQLSEDFSMVSSRNLFLENAQPITFNLGQGQNCSILTGANSGGKTTLIEHVIQMISLLHLGLPTRGETKIPVFQEVYYFAKNKGSMSKGAFETLLTQLSTIKPGKSTMILADEIESVTEPGVAGTIICATAKYFIEKNCFMILATHLGREMQGQLPLGARIDGIEAKGLTELFELIVDHNPIMGKLAHSTPELIIERLAYSQKEPYFIHLHDYLKKRKD